VSPDSPGIKFCGITIPGDAGYAAELGASHVGVIFAESSRKVSEDTARAVFDAAGPNLRHVAVFGSDPIDAIGAQATRIGADVVQLHGTLDADAIAALRGSFSGDIWAVVSLEPGTDRLPESVLDVTAAADGVLLDARVGNRSGGTGRSLSWRSIAGDVEKLASRIPVILAGGLRPENVAEALAAIRPSVVDVSSGVEKYPGVKDRPRMKAFAEAVRAASIVGWKSTPTELDGK
jgi:phosphoribosylanthranilate isomerase